MSPMTHGRAKKLLPQAVDFLIGTFHWVTVGRIHVIALPDHKTFRLFRKGNMR